MTDMLVYIPDLPSNIPENDLRQMIQRRIETNQRMKLRNVECYLELGIAVIELMEEDDKNHLVSNVQSIILDPKRNINVSFVDELELDAHIVTDRNSSNIPTASEVARRCADIYKITRVDTCESISVQFPNIFRIIFRTLGELRKAASLPDFKIGTGIATVYPRVDCSFFEDLLTNVDEDKIISAINTQIGQKLPSTSLYVQCNKQTGSAVVLASKSARKWTMERYLTINGQNIPGKPRLAYRVVVSPVPRDFNIDAILRHRLFTGRIDSYKHIDDKLIVELNHLDYYNECLQFGACRVAGITINIERHTVVVDPDISELDAFNWYETAMLDMKPDIMTVINNYQHPIFRCKWNAQNWIEQMKKTETTSRPSKGYNLTRHLLRVTVMLNTITTLRKRRYIVDDNEVTLKHERMKTIGYDHKSKLFIGKKIHESELKTPYPSTTVKVINGDCLVLYEQLVADGCRPLLLNMANASIPGGGYRKGDGAQEENLFRRSDYYHSLDGEIADRDRSERLYCTPRCELTSLTGFGDFYPMDEFGAIYTSGITVFRGTEAEGYPYMKNPLYNVCAIAMAAYRDPSLDKENMLENKLAVNTYRKIENIFGIAYQHKHDCLVLSALGCGAFKNPPRHIALLFKSVIYQYAGYFDKIYFAIIDDHNTGNKINPQGNFAPFKELLDGMVVRPPKSLRMNGVSGPYRILDKTSNGQITLGDARILYLSPCEHGTNCRDIKKADHTSQYSHPPRCSLQSATSQCDQMDDEVHKFTFMHTTKCKDGGECTSKDPAHWSDFDHPDFCKNHADCNDIRPEHLFTFRHLPICPDGVDCPKHLRHEEDHRKSFRHCKAACLDDNCCTKFHDKTHWRNTIHSFRKPCPFTPYNCSKYVEYVQNGTLKTLDPEVEQHCLQCSHVCLYGRQCRETDDKHYETTIHIARQLCPYGDNCSKLSKEDHLESFAHPGIRDIRLLCRDPGFMCKQRSENRHLRIYRHGQNHDHLTVAPSSNLNSHINFVQNQGQLIKTVHDYVDKSSWKKAKISPEILDWIRALQPAHRCSPHIFQSILVHGHVMSRHYMTLLEIPANVAKAVLQHQEVRAIILKHNNRGIKENAFNLIQALVVAEFSKTGADGITSLASDHEERLNRAKTRLKVSLDDNDLKTINDWTVKIAQASIALHGAPMGIGFDVDQKMGTDKHVFSILGPHLGFYYGDIVIIFKQEIMFHPDTNFSVQAGTSFNSGRTYTQRPWITDSGTQDKRVADFHSSKLHCSVPSYEHAAATELVALTGINTKSMNVDHNDVVQRWKKVDSHFVFEGHLPQLIPLDYVDCVYMPKNVFEFLTPEAQESTKKMFKNSLIISDHIVDLDAIKPGGTIPALDATRQPYLKYILDEIDKKIQQKTNSPRISRGIVITVPSSNFDQQIALPMTISQSYDLYRLGQPQAPNTPEYTYIYWQAMHGDMMLTIANEKIQPGKDQPDLRCLVCYVAGKPSTMTEDYHESYSYLNDGHPFQHDTNVPIMRFRAKSNVFYRGCNTDDFFTFCLKISHKTSEATLFHAGPNGIYNHEKIYYKFDKTDLDLSKIDYIHVSGGNQDVPIRNLTINHERVAELHPSFDMKFTINTSKLQQQSRTSVDHITRGPHIKNTPSSYQGDAPEPYKQRPPSIRPPSPPSEKPNMFRWMIDTLVGSSPKDNPSAASNSSVNQEISSSARVESSKLTPCPDSVYCLNQDSKDHTKKYSHPCRFNELCQKQADEPHLVHERHNASRCSDDRNCSKKTNSVHRAEYRHTGLSDYLIPCRDQETCSITSSEHRQKYFHGEELPSIKKNKTLTPATKGAGTPTTYLIKCMHGNDCRSMKNPQHTARYSHPTS